MMSDQMACRIGPMIRLLFSFAAVIASSLSVGSAVHAQRYPNRTIKLIVPFPAGGATDNAARLVAQRLQAGLGQSVIIENQAGAGGTTGTRQAAIAAADGYTLLMASIGTFGSMPLLYKLDFDPQRAFAPVATVVFDKSALVVRPSLPVKTVADLVQYAKAHPGKLSYGSAIGIGPHFVAELFKIKSGADIVHIPYRGGAPMVADLIAGQIDMTVNGKSVLLPQIQAGKLRALAVTAGARWRELPDVPTLVETGYMDAPYDTLFGVVAPAGTPESVIGKLNATINEGLRSAEMGEHLMKIGIEPIVTTPQEFADIIAREVPKWAAIVKATGVRVAE
jgi:tripartite-type tricarboxylate transporter receptor subunit TctC